MKYDFSIDRYIHVTTHRLLLIYYSITISFENFFVRFAGKQLAIYNQLQTLTYKLASYIAFISLSEQTKMTLHCDIDNV